MNEPPSAMGAVDAATYFVELYPYVMATGDTAEWEKLSAPDCVFCSDTHTYAAGLAAQGTHREGGAVAVGFSVVSADGPSSYRVDLLTDEAPSRIIGNHGEVVEDWAQFQSYRMGVALLHDGTSWSITAVEATPVDW